MAPLLADLIRLALEGRGAFEISIGDPNAPPAVAPDVVILGPRVRIETELAMRRSFPEARILALTADLSRLRDRIAGNERELALEALLEHLRG